MDVEQGNFLKDLLKPRQTTHTYLFATSVETTQKFISLKTDQFSSGRDAFQKSWSQGLNYAFAPFRLIGTVLAKIQKEKATLILVIPANIKNPILLPS